MPIAILATGNEITSGDILNTNGQIIAATLTDAGFAMGMHVCAVDEKPALCQALAFLLDHHDFVIIIGGLGPTSDDLTRFALAETLDIPLEFSEESWQRIINRFQQYNLSVPDNNKQQSLFPIGAYIYPNQQGTADGCCFEKNNKTLFMLPGPPAECLPIFFNHVLPHLQEKRTTPAQKILRWRLFGVSEGHVAKELDSALADTGVITGYRVDYPYIEFKCTMPADRDPQNILEKIEPIMEPLFLSDPYRKASEMLLEHLSQPGSRILIHDPITQGFLERQIHTPATHARVRFQPSDDFSPALIFMLEGLDAFWKSIEGARTITFTITEKNQLKEPQHFEFPYRSNRVLKQAAELAADYILRSVATHYQ